MSTYNMNQPLVDFQRMAGGHLLIFSEWQELAVSGHKTSFSAPYIQHGAINTIPGAPPDRLLTGACKKSQKKDTDH